MSLSATDLLEEIQENYENRKKNFSENSLRFTFTVRESPLFYFKYIHFYLLFLFPNIYKKKTIIAVVTKSSKMNSSDADVEQSLLDDFDIHLVSIENILKPFIKQVSECPNQ